MPDIILDDIENKDLSNANLIFEGTKDNDNSDVMLRDSERMIDYVPELEEELETWESFYRSNYDVFELIRKWKELNDRY